MGGHDHAEVSGQALRDLGPGLGAVIAAVGAPVGLRIEAVVAATGVDEVVYTLADFGVDGDVRVVLGPDVSEVVVGRLPGGASILAAEDARRGDCHPHAVL